MNETQSGGITLTGPPRNAFALIPLGAWAGRVVPVTMRIGGGDASLRAYVHRASARSGELRLRLPRATPPGRYTGVAQVGDEEREIVVEVQPELRLRVRPEQTELSASAGARAVFGVTLSNTGNVAFDVPKAMALDLRDTEGYGRSLGRALRAELPPGERRVDRFFEELREQHGGEARVEVMEGAGALQPGESRPLRCRIDVPEMVRPGRAYSGTWRLDDAAHEIVIEVNGAAPRTRGRTVQ